MRTAIFIVSLAVIAAFIPQFIEAVKAKQKNLLIIRASTLALMLMNAVLNLVLMLRK